MKVLPLYSRNSNLMIVRSNENKCNSNSFGNLKTNADYPARAMVNSNNLASIARISYTNVHNINRKQVSFGNSPEQVAERVAKVLFKHRTQHPKNPCVQEICPECTGAIQKAVLPFIQKNAPIQMTMAAFPFKAMSRLKCINEYPDMAEVISLRFLHSIIEDIGKEYTPGAKLTIYNDGLMYTPIAVNPPDRKAIKYIRHLKEIIQQIGADKAIEMKTLKDYYGDEMAKGREEILDRYPLDITTIKQKALDPNDKEVDSEYYTGAKRFTLEKMNGMEDGELEEILKERYEGRPDDPRGVQYNNYIECARTSGNNRLGKKAKERLAGEIAVDTIRRSKAWGAFINSQQPDALRLSCHPQACGSSKVGIFLTPDHNNWGTPWQLTAVEVSPGEYVLAKRSCAEELGFEVVYPHYRIPAGRLEAERASMIDLIRKKT